MKFKSIVILILLCLTIYAGYLNFICTPPSIKSNPQTSSLSQPFFQNPPSESKIPSLESPSLNPPQKKLLSNKIKCTFCSFLNESTDRYCLNCAKELWSLSGDESREIQQKNKTLLHQRNQKVEDMVKKEKAFIVRRNLFFSSKDILERLKKMEAYKDLKREEMDSLLTDIAKCYQLTIHYNYSPEDIFLKSLTKDKTEASAPDFKDVVHTLNVVDEFFSPYPVELIRSEIHDLYFVSSLKINGKAAAGEALVGRKKFLISCNSANDHNNTLKTFHHEFAHLVTGQNSGIFPVREWIKSIPQNWEYRNDYWTSNRKIKSDNPTNNLLQAGFIREYGQESLQEDIATLSEELFTNPEKIFELSNKYPVLNTKIRLLTQFYSKFGVQFNLEKS